MEHGKHNIRPNRHKLTWILRAGMHLRLLLGIMTASMLAGCSFTKYLPEDGVLLDRAHIEGNLGNVTEEELMDYVRQQPNARVLGLWRMNLAIYSLSNPEKDNAWNRWLRRIGTPPVVYDSTLAIKTTEQLKFYMMSKGYYNARVEFSTTPSRRKRRLQVHYNIECGNLYTIADLQYSIKQKELSNIIMADTSHCLIRNGNAFDQDVFNAERDRITRNLKNNGYYDFDKDMIFFQADTTIEKNKAYCHLYINHIVPKSTIKDVTIELGRRGEAYKEATRITADSALTVCSDTVIMFSPKMLALSTFIGKDSTYNVEDVELTEKRFRSMEAFGGAATSFNVIETDSIANTRKLHGTLRLTQVPTQNYGIDLEGTNSSGNLGGAVSLRYQHINIMHGAEVLNVKFRFASQNQFARDGKEHFATIEAGAEVSLNIPKLLAPWSNQHVIKRHRPKTTFLLSYDYQHRPDFTRSVISGYMQYLWHGSSYATHAFTPIETNIVKLPHISGEWEEYIKKSYLQYSYQDHFILSIAYQFLFNQQQIKNRGWYVRLGIETAGNLTNAFAQGQKATMVVSEDGKSWEKYRSIWGIRYSQYVRTDLEVRHQTADWWMNKFVWRIYAGIGIPYGNSKMLPFEKSFFAGGANSIRAWAVRNVGPGEQEADKTIRYHNQTSDMRLEANIEYRFKMVSVLEGAAFVDAGNIWALKRSTNNTKAQISPQFYKQIAIGSGLGLRFNFSYFILRFDAAVKLHDPTRLNEKGGWIIASRPFKFNHINYNFAIGYPF